jgi:hypothetical protein
MNVTTCPGCGITYGVGASPWCRDQHGRGANYIEDVTWPGGITFENLGHDPVTLYSPAELKREMDARGLQPMVRHTDGDTHTRSWATMDAQTLENGRILAERQANSTVKHHDPGPNASTVAEVKRAFAEQGVV